MGTRNDLPKLSIAALLITILLAAESVVSIFKSFFPIDCPLVDSKKVPFAKIAT